MHFSKLESIHAIGTNSQVKGSNKLFDFLEQSNQRKNCDSKIYYKIFLSSPPTYYLQFVNLVICYMFINVSTILRICYFLILMIFFVSDFWIYVLEN
jgi:hypothetical protein